MFSHYLSNFIIGIFIRNKHNYNIKKNYIKKEKTLPMGKWLANSINKNINNDTNS